MTHNRTLQRYVGGIVVPLILNVPVQRHLPF